MSIGVNRTANLLCRVFLERILERILERFTYRPVDFDLLAVPVIENTLDSSDFSQNRLDIAIGFF